MSSVTTPTPADYREKVRRNGSSGQWSVRDPYGLHDSQYLVSWKYRVVVFFGDKTIEKFGDALHMDHALSLITWHKDIQTHMWCDQAKSV